MSKVRPICVPDVALGSRARSAVGQRSERVDRRLQVLTIASWIAAAVSSSFGAFQLILGGTLWWMGAVNLICAAVFLVIPRLGGFSELVAPLTFVVFAYLSVGFICFTVGTGTGLQFYFLVAASLVVLVFGIERIVMASMIVAVGVVITIILEVTVPQDRGLGPSWTLTAGFISSTVSAAVMIVATIWYTLREVERVLVPEGRVVISGLNPASLWGLRQQRGLLCQRLGLGQLFLPEHGEFIGHWRLRDWLRLLSFEVESAQFGCYRPAIDTARWLDRFAWMESSGARWWPIFGAVYFLVATKRVRGMRLLEAGWKNKTKRAAAPAVVANRRPAQSDASVRSTSEP